MKETKRNIYQPSDRLWAIAVVEVLKKEREHTISEAQKQLDSKQIDEHEYSGKLIAANQTYNKHVQELRKRLSKLAINKMHEQKESGFIKY